MYEVKHYPLFYFQRGKESDINWILARMAYIPLNKQEEVSDQYVKLFQEKNGRRKANEYLNNVAREWNKQNYLARGQK